MLFGCGRTNEQGSESGRITTTFYSLDSSERPIIFVGAPNAPCSIDENSMITMKIKSKGNNMGDLMLDGFRYGAPFRAEQVWSLEGVYKANVE